MRNKNSSQPSINYHASYGAKHSII